MLFNSEALAAHFIVEELWKKEPHTNMQRRALDILHTLLYALLRVYDLSRILCVVEDK